MARTSWRAHASTVAAVRHQLATQRIREPTPDYLAFPPLSYGGPRAFHHMCCYCSRCERGVCEHRALTVLGLPTRKSSLRNSLLQSPVTTGQRTRNCRRMVGCPTRVLGWARTQDDGCLAFRPPRWHAAMCAQHSSACSTLLRWLSLGGRLLFSEGPRLHV